MRISVIDLGSNTCDLLIAEVESSGYKILFQGKEAVRLNQNKHNENWIRDEAFSRTLQALNYHLKKSNDFGAGRIKLVATSAVRDASNRDEFTDFIRIKTGLETQVLTGEQEAELIFNGVLLAFQKINEPSLILDIGSGSNELIIAGEDGIIWKDSLPTGMGRIINMFEISDPVSKDEITELNRFFRIQNTEAIKEAGKAGVTTLIGCAGAFDTIADLIDKVAPGTKKRIKQRIEIYEFRRIYNKILKSTRTERKEMKGMDKVRIDLMVPAIILINQVIDSLGIDRIYQTHFALREGILFEILESDKQTLTQKYF